MYKSIHEIDMEILHCCIKQIKLTSLIIKTSSSSSRIQKRLVSLVNKGFLTIIITKTPRVTHAKKLSTTPATVIHKTYLTTTTGLQILEKWKPFYFLYESTKQKEKH